MNKDPDIVTEEDPLNILDSKSVVCMSGNGKDTNHTRQIDREVHFVRNGEKWKMHKVEWFEVVLQLSDIATRNLSGKELNPRIKYLMVSFTTDREKLYKMVDKIQDSLWNKISIWLD